MPGIQVKKDGFNEKEKRLNSILFNLTPSDVNSSLEQTKKAQVVVQENQHTKMEVKVLASNTPADSYLQQNGYNKSKLQNGSATKAVEVIPLDDDEDDEGSNSAPSPDAVPEYIHCTACNKNLNVRRRKICKHPKLHVLLCKVCLKFINTSKFNRDDIGIEESCTWCGDGGNLVCCDFCEKAYCKHCIKRNVGKEFFEALVKAPDTVKWKCFSCDQTQIESFVKECDIIMKFIKEQRQNDSISIDNGPSKIERLKRIAEASKAVEGKTLEPARHKSSFPQYEDDTVEVIDGKEGYINNNKKIDSNDKKTDNVNNKIDSDNRKEHKTKRVERTLSNTSSVVSNTSSSGRSSPSTKTIKPVVSKLLDSDVNEIINNIRSTPAKEKNTSSVKNSNSSKTNKDNADEKEVITHSANRTKRRVKSVSYNEKELQRKAEEEAESLLKEKEKEKKKKKKKKVVTIEISSSSDESDEEIVIVNKHGKKKTISKSLLLAAQAVLEKNEKKAKHKKSKRDRSKKDKKDKKGLGSFLRVSFNKNKSNDNSDESGSDKNESDSENDKSEKSESEEDQIESTPIRKDKKNKNEEENKKKDEMNEIKNKKSEDGQKNEKADKTSADNINEESSCDDTPETMLDLSSANTIMNSEANEKEQKIVMDDQKPGPSGVRPKNRLQQKRKPRGKKNSDSDLSDNETNNGLIQYTPLRNSLIVDEDLIYSPNSQINHSHNVSENEEATVDADKQLKEDVLNVTNEMIDDIENSEKDVIETKKTNIENNEDTENIKDQEKNDDQLERRNQSDKTHEKSSKENKKGRLSLNKNKQSKELTNQEDENLNQESMEVDADIPNKDASVDKSLKNNVSDSEDDKEAEEIEEDSTKPSQDVRNNAQPVVVLSEMDVSKYNKEDVNNDAEIDEAENNDAENDDNVDDVSDEEQTPLKKRTLRSRSRSKDTTTDSDKEVTFKKKKSKIEEEESASSTDSENDSAKKENTKKRQETESVSTDSENDNAKTKNTKKGPEMESVSTDSENLSAKKENTKKRPEKESVSTDSENENSEKEITFKKKKSKRQESLDTEEDSASNIDSNSEVETSPKNKNKRKRTAVNSDQDSSKKSKEKSNSDSDIEVSPVKKKKRTKRRKTRNSGDSDSPSSKKSKLLISSNSDDSDGANIRRRRRLSSKDDENSSSDDSDDDSVRLVESNSDSESDEPIIITRTRGKKAKGKTKKKNTKEKVTVSSGSDDENNSPSKGRRKIRRILKDTELNEETLHARELEENRRQRLLERTKKDRESIEQVIKVDDGEFVLERNDKKEPLVSVAEDINKHLKPHQRKGIKFMYDCLIETIKGYKKGDEGSGCLLAHCMGLGKTLQVVSFTHTLMNNENIKMKSFMVVAPLNTVLNWEQEFEKWIKYDERIDVFVLSNCAHMKDRIRTLKDWHKDGGVLIIGYEMYRNLVNGKFVKSKKHREEIKTYLVDPGPEIVVCDEGHVLRNSTSAISVAMNNIKTKRRVVLTGTPLQNNLPEYFVMVDFVKPKLLGTKKEFQNRFVNPIHNGQCSNSTPRDVKVMKQRCHVLFQLLSGCVQRQDYSVLTPFLPSKREYTIFVRLSEKQIKMYQYYLENFVYQTGDKLKGSSLFSDFHCLARICSHPWALHLERLKSIERNKYKDESDFLDDEDDEESSNDENAEEDGDKKPWTVEDSSDEDDRAKRKMRRAYVSDSDSDKSSSSEAESEPDIKDVKPITTSSRRTTRNSAASAIQNKTPIKNNNEKIKKPTSTKSPQIGALRSGINFKDSEQNPERVEEKPQYEKEWYDEFLTEEDEHNIEISGKMVLLLEILANAEVVGDKVLVFSQSLVSLDMIESSLGGGKVGGNQLNWCHGVDYFRMDGSTPIQKRQRWAEIFNDSENPMCRLFLISTKAGSLGINMVGANRVVMFDCSWNPSHDVQSVFRVYRFGQEKPVYVYRMISQGGMEEKIYDRQITKLAVAGRVVDEQQIERHFTDEQIRELYTFAPEDVKDSETPQLPKDPLLAEVLQRHHPKNIVRYHEHDLLLENVTSEELTEEERQQAWKSYEDEKENAARRITYNVQNNENQGFATMMEEQRRMIAERLTQINPGPNEQIKFKITIPNSIPREQVPAYIEEKKREMNLLLIEQRNRQLQQQYAQQIQQNFNRAPQASYNNSDIRIPLASNIRLPAAYQRINFLNGGRPVNIPGTGVYRNIAPGSMYPRPPPP